MTIYGPSPEYMGELECGHRVAFDKHPRPYNPRPLTPEPDDIYAWCDECKFDAVVGPVQQVAA